MIMDLSYNDVLAEIASGKYATTDSLLELVRSVSGKVQGATDTSTYLL